MISYNDAKRSGKSYKEKHLSISQKYANNYISGYMSLYNYKHENPQNNNAYVKGLRNSVQNKYQGNINNKNYIRGFINGYLKEENEENEENKENNNQNGGSKNYSGTYRHFKIINLNGKDVNFDYIAKIKETQTPLSAAKKLLKSICLHQGLKGMKKLQCNATYIIKETTQSSAKKTFGPYKGSYIKYTPSEAKKAMASGISFKMKPFVKLSKKNVL